jgi:hypothetical protein
VERGLGFGRGSDGRWRTLPCLPGSLARAEDDLTCGPHMSASNRRGKRYPFGLTGIGPGRLLAWAGMVSPACFLFSLFLYFPFLFF